MPPLRALVQEIHTTIATNDMSVFTVNVSLYMTGNEIFFSIIENNSTNYIFSECINALIYV